jgi:1-acyl-sn-glycerol-3-phosphate acyltransferase
MKPYSVPLTNRLFRAVFRPIFRLIFHLLSDVQVIGKGNVPKRGAYIICINHVSLFEPPLILAFWPTAPEAAGAVDIWSRPGQGTLAQLYGGIPVHRGEFDRQLLETMIAVLKSGKPLLLAPEGGRTHELGMRRALPGVAYIADKTAVPVIPVGITGTTDDFFTRAIHLHRPRLEIRIGNSLTLPQVLGNGSARREALQANADQIMQAIAALIPSDYGGVYQASRGSG